MFLARDAARLFPLRAARERQADMVPTGAIQRNSSRLFVVASGLTLVSEAWLRLLEQPSHLVQFGACSKLSGGLAFSSSRGPSQEAFAAHTHFLSAFASWLHFPLPHGPRTSPTSWAPSPRRGQTVS